LPVPRGQLPRKKRGRPGRGVFHRNLSLGMARTATFAVL
jgi:hypothetical protein